MSITTKTLGTTKTRKTRSSNGPVVAVHPAVEPQVEPTQAGQEPLTDVTTGETFPEPQGAPIEPQEPQAEPQVSESVPPTGEPFREDQPETAQAWRSPMTPPRSGGAQRSGSEGLPNTTVKARKLVRKLLTAKTEPQVEPKVETTPQPKVLADAKVSIALPTAVKIELEALSKSLHRPVSELARQAIVDFLKAAYDGCADLDVAKPAEASQITAA